jgi:hypothetical protein
MNIGSGVIPIIKDINNVYYFVFFKSIVRKTKNSNIIEDSGGKLEGDNYKISAIRELKEESSLLLNLECLKNKKDIKLLNKILTKFSVNISHGNSNYISHLIYLENLEKNYFDLEELHKEFISNMRSFWANGFSFYTENKDIVFVPVDKLNNYEFFERTQKILDKLLTHNINNIIKEISKVPIILKKNIVNDFNYGFPKKINNLVSYN